MQYAMDVQVILWWPFHHLVDDLDRFSRIVDVEKQVSDSVDDDQSIALVLGKRIVYDLYPDGGRVLSQTDKVKVLVVDACR